ncbi:hypothetical protein FXN65_23990 [Metapseudomonas lalkuanensis]|uniref:Uncharacterized protein n=1 Tax=Metapseudomonas lalkuanensis TaxID=2604832 RepID=A0A5J6QUI3_9GAMM|nr:hypothetical protein [Pseudomonas lalkuanensis]QEY64971.1 hypothetical protein FXN65_23990 [Pseudomonas lalkuanensis]
MAQLQMINEPGLAERLQSSLREATGSISLTEVRDCISNPRIRDFYVRDLDASGLPLAGASALSEISMLADSWQKTYAISLSDWRDRPGTLQLVDRFHFQDPSIAIVQVWYCDPREIHPHELTWLLALAVSFTDCELRRCERTCGAINEVLEPHGFALEDSWF